MFVTFLWQFSQVLIAEQNWLQLSLDYDYLNLDYPYERQKTCFLFSNHEQVFRKEHLLLCMYKVLCADRKRYMLCKILTLNVNHGSLAIIDRHGPFWYRNISAIRMRCGRQVFVKVNTQTSPPPSPTHKRCDTHINTWVCSLR